MRAFLAQIAHLNSVLSAFNNFQKDPKMANTILRIPAAQTQSGYSRSTIYLRIARKSAIAGYTELAEFASARARLVSGKVDGPEDPRAAFYNAHHARLVAPSNQPGAACHRLACHRDRSAQRGPHLRQNR